MDDQPTITPLPLGLFTLPGHEAAKYPGVVVRAPYVVCAYLVRAPDLTLLFDTGIVGDEEAVSRYAPRHFPLAGQAFDVVRFAHDLAEWRAAPSFVGSLPRAAWIDG